jgi:hypothetical protein
MNKRLSFILAFGLTAALFVLGSAQAAIIYVDKDNPCPGAGTDANPYCSIQRAFNVAVAGDRIRIRDSATPYDESATAQNSGTSGNPITVEPDIGHHPILRYSGNGATTGVININHSYWTIQNLTFDGTGVNTSRLGIWIMLGGDHVQFLTNTLKNWGQSIAGTYNVTGLNINNVTDMVVRGNVFDGNARESISVNQSTNLLVENNEFKNQKCGLNSDGDIYTVGIRMLYSNGVGGYMIRNNTFHDFQTSANCPLTTAGNKIVVGIHADVGPINGTVTGNHIWNVQHIGIHIEQDCYNWLVTNNVIHDISLDGIRHNPTSNGPANTYVNNTIYNVGRYGIGFYSPNAVIKNNIFDNAGTANINVDPRVFTLPGTPPVFDYNDYWDNAGGTKVGIWNGGAVRTFSSWKTVCTCDAHSLSRDPLFVNPPSDFHLQPSSPARGAGEGGVDMGAYSAPSPPTNLRVIQILP